MELEVKLENLDHSFVKTSIEICNVPKRLQETKNALYDSLMNLCKSVDVNIQLSDIRDVLRQPSKREHSRSTIITVEFTYTLAKSNLLWAVKAYNNTMPSKKVNSTLMRLIGPIVPIYIAEQLTINSRHVFSTWPEVFPRTIDTDFVGQVTGELCCEKIRAAKLL